MKKIMFLSVLVLANLAIAAINLKTDVNASKVEFLAVGKPAMIKIKGEGGGVESALSLEKNVLNGNVKFSVTSLKTGIDLRDDHLKNKYLNVDKHPEATLTFKDFALPTSFSLANPLVNEIPFRANLKLHGVEKPVEGTFTVDSKKLSTKAKFNIKITDFGITLPEYLGVKVADQVQISINIDRMFLVK